MARLPRRRASILFSGLLLLTLILSFSGSGTAGNPHSAYYSTDNTNVLWFIQTSDTHIGAGATASKNLNWMVTTGRTVIEPSFILVSGDLTDSTNGGFFPSGPYQTEWNTYKSIVDPNVDATNYFDIPGNHEAYNDKTFAYYLANSVQGRAYGRTQISFARTIGAKKYHFLGINTADNTGSAFSIWPPYYGDHAGLDSTELAYISSELTTNSDAELTMVFGHHPLGPTGNSSDTYVYYGLSEFLSLMDSSYSALYGYGHTHAFSERFFIPAGATHEGFFYFNVASLGKSSDNQYTIVAIDCNGISSKTMTMGTWPAVLVTAPVDADLGGNTGGLNPYAYTVPKASSNPIRALVFDPATLTSVQYSIDGGAKQTMLPASGNAHLYEALWDASALAAGLHTITVQATDASSRTTNDTIRVNVTTPVQKPKMGATALLTGKYTTAKRGSPSVFNDLSTFVRGDKIIFRATITDASGTPVVGATVQMAISGPSSLTLPSATTNSAGIAETSWQTTAPNKRGTGGTPTGTTYTVKVTSVAHASYIWDGVNQSAGFSITQ